MRDGKKSGSVTEIPVKKILNLVNKPRFPAFYRWRQLKSKKQKGKRQKDAVHLTFTIYLLLFTFYFLLIFTGGRNEKVSDYIWIGIITFVHIGM
jgi:hypothetical protein